jgi:transposase InsO family protein
VEHVPGKDNVVADPLSRLCASRIDDIEEDDRAHSSLGVFFLGRSSFEESTAPPSMLSDPIHLCALTETGADRREGIRPEDPLRLQHGLPMPPTSTVPIADHTAQIAHVHNHWQGHHGVEQTLDRLRRYLSSVKLSPYRHMRRNVQHFVQHCAYCQAASQIRPSIVTKPYTLAQYAPMVQLHIDTIGPLPKDDQGHEYILVIIDAFTRFVELYATKDTTALSAAQCLLDHAGRYGFPQYIRSDNGTQFSNEVIAQLTFLLRSEQQFITPYSSEENGLVERANREVMRHLRAIIFSQRDKNQWAMNQLPLVQRILNTFVHKSTGYSAAQMLFGNAIDLDRGILYDHRPVPSETAPPTASAYVQNLVAAQSAILKAAAAAQKELDTHHLQRRAERDTAGPLVPTDFPINSYVMRLHPTERPPTKFHTKWAGPYRVVNHIVTTQTYALQDLLTNKTFNAHVTQLKQFIFDDEDAEAPLRAAMAAQQEFIVEAILDHEGTYRDRKNMTFLVRWKGFPGQDSWEPYKNLLGTAQLDYYCYTHQLRSLLPKGYTPP